MRAALSVTVCPRPVGFFWPLLVAELGCALLILSSGAAPAVAIRALQLFLRF